jgi:hypothetical protein
MRSLARAAGLVSTIAFVPALAAAQAALPTAAADPTVTAPAEADTPSADATAKPVVAATGYSYGAATTQRPEHARVRPRPGNPEGTDALMAGFETLADGSTRLFVELRRPVAYDTRVGRSSLTYVLRGAYVDRRNNQNPLVTVDFNTPVTSARLAPHGRDLWLVVDLRANVQPTATMDAGKDGAATLRIEFPKGEYLALATDARSKASSSSAPIASAPSQPADVSPAKAAH